MEVYKWIKYHDSKMLTIGDLKKWKIGTTKNVIIFDCNFEEYLIWNLTPNEKYDTKYFFQANKHKITYLGDLNWMIHYNFGNSFEHRVEVNIEKYDNGCHWMPFDCNKKYITLDHIHIKNRHVQLPKNKQKLIHFSELDDNTKIGWRGPIMLSTNFAKIKNRVYYEELSIL